MVNTIIQSLFYFLPAYCANAVPVILSRYGLMNVLAIRVDFGLKFLGDDLFGSTKTYRGILGGVLGATFVILIQSIIYIYLPQFKSLFILEYNLPQILFLGGLMGLGEGLGDLFKSFIKRRLHIKSSAPFFPFDQLSFLGALLLSMSLYVPSVGHILTILIVSPLLPVVANLIAFRLGLKKVWW